MRSLLCLCALAACATPPSDPLLPAPRTVSAPEPSWVSERVATAHAHLDASEGGKLLRKAIDAHGGLGAWLSPGTVQFDFHYLPEGKPERLMYTRNQLDTWSVRAAQTELGPAADATLGWDGQSAWVSPGPEAFPSPARFWATTPYYFVGIPFVLADPGTHYQLEGSFHLVDPAGGSVDTVAVRVTYEPGTGEAPDDFYVVHLDPSTFRLVALRYIVTSPTIHPDGGRGSETILFYRDLQPTDGGPVVARHYDGFFWRDGAAGERKSTVEITNVSLGAPIAMDAFSPPLPSGRAD